MANFLDDAASGIAKEIEEKAIIELQKRGYMVRNSKGDLRPVSRGTFNKSIGTFKSAQSESGVVVVTASGTTGQGPLSKHAESHARIYELNDSKLSDPDLAERIVEEAVEFIVEQIMNFEERQNSG